MSKAAALSKATDLNDSYDFGQMEGGDATSSRDDIDDFERRLQGGGAAHSSKSNKAVAAAKPAVKAPASAPASQGAVNINKSEAKSLSEEEIERAEDKQAVADLDAFDKRIAK